ncbi:MAG: hypothetical protein AB4352_23380 [Hormoscilla sp.]
MYYTKSDFDNSTARVDAPGSDRWFRNWRSGGRWGPVLLALLLANCWNWFGDRQIKPLCIYAKMESN